MNPVTRAVQRAIQRLLAPLFALLYDRILAKTEAAGLGARRDALLAHARGDVLEIGAGTGVNLPRYGPAVTSLTLSEPEAPMRARLAARACTERPDARVIDAPAERLPLPDASVDTVVCTLVLCTVPDPAAALAEIKRVLRPDGRLLLLEHVLASDPALQRVQHRIEPVWSTVGGGCHLTRDTAAAVQAAGFVLDPIERFRLRKAPRFASPAIEAIARPVT